VDETVTKEQREKKVTGTVFSLEKRRISAYAETPAFLYQQSRRFV